MGDCGRYPMIISFTKSCIKYWLRSLHLPGSRYVRKCYEMLRMLDTSGKINWVTKVRQTLYKNGFGYIWENQGVRNEDLFLSEFTQRMKDQYLQTWSNICQTSPKLITYVQFKTKFDFEPYLNLLTLRKFRFALTSFRCSSHELMIEKGRYYGIERDQRFCPICKSVLEDEFHFVLICPLYKTLRENYIAEKYYKPATFQHFKILLASRNETVLRNLATYLHHSFKLRKEFVSNNSQIYVL